MLSPLARLLHLRGKLRFGGFVPGTPDFLDTPCRSTGAFKQSEEVQTSGGHFSSGGQKNPSGRLRNFFLLSLSFETLLRVLSPPPRSLAVSWSLPFPFESCIPLHRNPH